MSKCPNCRADLTDADIRAKACPKCSADLSRPGTLHTLPGDATVELESIPLDRPEDSAGTIDVSESVRAELSDPGTGGLSAGVDRTSPDGPLEDDGNTVDLSAMPPSGPNQLTVDRTPDPTVHVSGDHDDVDFEIQHVKATWEGTVVNATPGMTIKQMTDSATGSRSSLVIRDREVRESDTTDVAMADYDLIEQLGEGGMGVVYTARQASIDRTVAVKMLKPRMASDNSQKQKFLSEAVVTGELDHPNIVPIYELGRNKDGSLFYSMKKIQGTPWLEVLSTKSLGENIEILMKAADAVAFAHSRGVVHRDLKPENIMLGEFGEVLVLDWGLALTTEDCRKSVELDGPVGMGGTPAYMAPEMVVGPVEEIGKHSDIYLLGAILFECISGVPPHEGDTAMKCLMSAAKNVIRKVEQKGELIDIASRAMATDPAERYSTVQEFQQAIRTYQSHSESIALTARARRDLIAARKSDNYQELARALYVFEEAHSLWPDNRQAKQGVSEARLASAESAFRKGDYDLGLSVLDADDIDHKPLSSKLKMAQHERNARQKRLRNAKRAIVALGAIVFAAVTIGMVLFRIQKNEANHQRSIAVENELEARQQRDEADRQRKEAYRQREEADRQRLIAIDNEEEAKRQEQNAVAQRSRAERSELDAIEKRKRAEYEAYIAWIGLADSKIKENALGQARLILAQCSRELRDWEWHRLVFQCRQGLSRINVGQRLDCLAVSDDGSRLAAGSRDGIVRVWNLKDGQLINQLALPGTFATSLAFSPGRTDFLAVASGEADPYLRTWNLKTGKSEAVPVGHGDRITNVAFSPDGTRWVTASLDNTAIVWDRPTQRAVHILKGHSWWVWSAQFSHDGHRIVTASQDGTVRIWDADTGLQLLSNDRRPMPFRAHDGPVYTACFAPGDQHVASGGYDGRILMWRPGDLASFDFQQLLSDGQQSEAPAVEFDGHSAAVSRVAFSRDGRYVVSAGHDNRVRVWWAHDQRIDGTRVAAGTLYKTFRGHDSLVRDVVTSPVNNDVVISASYDGQLRIWGVREYEESRTIPRVVLRGHSDAILQARFSPDGERIVTASRDRSARVWSSADGQPEMTLREGHTYLTSTAAFYPTAQRQILTSAVDGTARAWDLETGTQTFVLPDVGPTAAANVSPDGRWIATSSRRESENVRTADSERVAKLWNARTGEFVRTFGKHRAAVTVVVFSPDSKWLFTGDANGRGNLWLVDNGQHWASTRRHTGRISSARFSPDGQWLLTGSEDKTVFQWDLASLGDGDHDRPVALETSVSRILRHPQAVTSLALTPDGAHVLTGCLDGRARYWNRQSAKVVWRWGAASAGTINAVDISSKAPLGLAVDSDHNLVILLDLETGDEIRIPSDSGETGHFLDLRQRGVIGWSACFSPDGNYVTTVGGDEARLWDLQARERMSFGPHRTVSSASYSNDGTRIVTASWDNSARIWNAQRGTPVRKLDDHLAGAEGGHRARVNAAAYSPDGNQLVTASDDQTVKIWEPDTGRVLRTLIGHGGPVLHVAYSADGRRLVSSSRDATARIWDARTGDLIRVLKGHRLAVLQACFSDDGRRVATGSEDFRAIVWNAQTGEIEVELPEQTDRVTSVAFSQAATRLLTGCSDHSVKLWDATNGREILTLAGHTREVTSVSFSPDGRSALSGSRDGTAIVWPTVSVQDEGRYDLDVPALTSVPAKTRPLLRNHADGATSVR